MQRKKGGPCSLATVNTKDMNYSKNCNFKILYGDE